MGKAVGWIRHPQCHAVFNSNRMVRTTPACQTHKYMMSKLSFAFGWLAVTSAVIGAPVFFHSLAPSGEKSDYQPFIGKWRINKYGTNSFSEPVLVSVSSTASNSLRVEIRQGGSLTEVFCYVSKVQSERFVCLPDLNGSVYNIYKTTLTNPEGRLELAGIDPMQLETDILQSVVQGRITEHSRGLKHHEVTSDGNALNNYIGSHISAFTNTWLVMERDKP
jgi:hypothetical protein